MHVLYINLTRFGDLLQSQAAISAAAQQGYTVHLACLEAFAGAAALLKHVEHVFPLPGAEFLRHIAKSSVDTQAGSFGPDGETGEWQRSLLALYLWREKIYETVPIDCLCNLSLTTAALFLTRFLAQERPVYGFGVDEHGSAHNSTPWAWFMQGTVFQRHSSPYNVVDLFRKVGALPALDPDLDNLKAAR